jgi:hypothetical protein
MTLEYVFSSKSWGDQSFTYARKGIAFLFYQVNKFVENKPNFNNFDCET